MSHELFVAAGAYEGIILGFKVKLDSSNPAIRLAFTEKSHTSSVKTLKLSGSVLLSGSSDENVHVFDIDRNRFFGALHFPEGDINAIETFECEGETPVAQDASKVRKARYALVADGNQRLTVLRVRPRRRAIDSIQTYKRALKPGAARSARHAPFNAITTHPSCKLILAVSNSSKRLFTFSFDSTAMGANRKPLKLEHTLPLHREPISVRWNESGSRYALALHPARSDIMLGDELRVYRVEDGCECSRLRMPGRLTSFEWLTNDQLIVACTDGTIRVFRVNELTKTELEAEDKKTEAAVCDCEWRVGDSRVKSLAVVHLDEKLEGNDRLIVCVSSDGLVSLLSASSASSSSCQLQPVCSFKSVFRLTCVAAGFIERHQPLASASAEGDADTEQQHLDQLEDDAIDAGGEEQESEANAARHSIVELASRNVGAQNRAAQKGGKKRPRPQNNKRAPGAGASANNKRQRQEPSSAGQEKSTATAPRRGTISKLEKKVRAWTTVEGMRAEKSTTKPTSSPNDRRVDRESKKPKK